MICLFVHQAAELYGSDRVLLALVQSLRAHAGCQPVVLLPEDGPLRQELEALGVEVHVVPLVKVSRALFSPPGLLGLFVQIPRSLKAISTLLAGRRIDVVHTNTLAVLSGAFWARLHGIPHVWHVHEIITRPKIVAWAFPVLLRLFSDRVVSISGMTQQNLLSRQPTLAAKSEIIFNGLDVPDLYTPAEVRDFRRALGPADKTLVTLVGRINHWKGQGLLVEAARILVYERGRDDVVFLMVGSPPKGQEEILDDLRARIRDAKVSDKVLIKEFVNNIWPVWAASDIAVIPSTEPEPFGMVAIEAMAMEKAVVAARHGGLLDIIEDGRSGTFFQPGEASALADRIEALLDAPDERRRLGLAARQRVQSHFSLVSQALSFKRAYETVTSDIDA